MKPKFGILRLIGSVYKVIGIILAIIAVIGAVGFCVMTIAGGAALGSLGEELGMGGYGMAGGAFGGILGGLFFLIGMGIAAISQYAIGEAIFLFLAIEENTRGTLAYLQRQAQQ